MTADAKRLGAAFRAGLFFSRCCAIAQDAAQWITVHPGGKGMKANGKGMKKGTPVLIDDQTGQVLGGMGGKFTGQHISEARKDFVGARQTKADKSERHYKKLLKAHTDYIESVKPQFRPGAAGNVIARLRKTREAVANHLDGTTQEERDEAVKKVDRMIEHLQSKYIDNYETPLKRKIRERKEREAKERAELEERRKTDKELDEYLKMEERIRQREAAITPEERRRKREEEANAREAEGRITSTTYERAKRNRQRKFAAYWEGNHPDKSTRKAD